MLVSNVLKRSIEGINSDDVKKNNELEEFYIIAILKEFVGEIYKGIEKELVESIKVLINNSKRLRFFNVDNNYYLFDEQYLELFINNYFDVKVLPSYIRFTFDIVEVFTGSMTYIYNILKPSLLVKSIVDNNIRYNKRELFKSDSEEPKFSNYTALVTGSEFEYNIAFSSSLSNDGTIKKIGTVNIESLRGNRVISVIPSFSNDLDSTDLSEIVGVISSYLGTEIKNSLTESFKI